MRTLLIAAFVASLAAQTIAHVVSKPVEYKEGDTVLEGLAVYNDHAPGKKPGILIIHQWKGITDYERRRAQMLVQLGYTVFVADIYGKGVRPADPKSASAEAAKYKENRALLRKRVQAGLEMLRKQEDVDTKKIAAIGYCFGGTTALELARSGADISGVVSFHGGLGAGPNPETPNIKSKVLALHGADDPFVPPAEVQGFEEEMRKAKADWQLVAYGGAVHSFTDWNAGNDNSKGAAHNLAADRRSWEAMKQFFAELFVASLPPRQ